MYRVNRVHRFLYEVHWEGPAVHGHLVAAFNYKADAMAYLMARESGSDDAAGHAAARKVRDKRERAKAARKAKADAMDSIGMTKTKYGWE